MLEFLPFRGIRFDWDRLPVGRCLCPPYDVIPADMAQRLRRIAYNTIHMELPEGSSLGRYQKARRIWEGWRRSGILLQDPEPGYYLLEQRFHWGSRPYRRLGLLGALRLTPEGLSRIVPHERTFPKPKEDRLRLLEAVGANTSPIFALYPDAGGQVRDVVRRAARGTPAAEGLATDGVNVRVWRLTDPRVLERIRKSLEAKTLLVADGHHRLEVNRVAGAGGVLCCLCAEEDPGLLVLPTHRVLEEGADLSRRISQECRLKPFRSVEALERAILRYPSPRAFGVITSDGSGGTLAFETGDGPAAPRKGRKGRFFGLAVPVGAVAGQKDFGELGVEWVANRLLNGMGPGEVRYTHAAGEAARLAGAHGLAILIKPIGVRDIRRAVRRAGLLPQKSTYFYPKVEAGVVFYQVDSLRS